MAHPFWPPAPPPFGKLRGAFIDGAVDKFEVTLSPLPGEMGEDRATY